MKVNYNELFADLGTDATQLSEIKFDTVIGQSLYDFAQQISQQMKSNLIESNSSNASSELLQSIAVVPTVRRGQNYLVVINGNDYAFFVDRGVSGTKNKFNSPFAFKNEGVSKKFQSSLMGWISKVGIPLESRYSQTRSLTKRARATKQIDEKKKIAYAMGVGIKRGGIEPTFFIQKAIDQPIINQYAEGLSKALGKQVLVIMSNNVKAWQ